MSTIESEPRVVDITVGGTVNAVLEFLSVDMVCNLDTYIVPLTSGLSIKSLPEGGIPTDIGKFLLEMRFTPDCKLWGLIWQPFPQLENIFPLPVEVTIAGLTYPMSILNTEYMEYDFTSNIMSLIQNGTINANTKDLDIVVKYPVKKTYNIFKPSLCTYKYEEETATVPVDISLSVPSITCIPAVSKFEAPSEFNITPGDLTSLPTLNPGTLPIVVDMSIPCTQNGGSASTPTNLFPMDLTLWFDDGKIPIKTDSYGKYSADLRNTVESWINTKIAAGVGLPSGVKLMVEYPEQISFMDASATGVKSTVIKRVEIWVPINSQPELNSICRPDVKFVELPTDIPIDATELLLPELKTAVITVKAEFTIECFEDIAPVDKPSDLFPIPVELFVNNQKAETWDIGSTPGWIRYNLSDFIKPMLPALVAAKATEIPIKLRYPAQIKYPARTLTYGDGVKDSIPLNIAYPGGVTPEPPTPGPIPGGEVVCKIKGSLSDPGAIPVAIDALGIPTLNIGSIPVRLLLTPSCDGETPDNLFTGSVAYVYINNAYISSLVINADGSADLDLTPYFSRWASAITADTSSMELQVVVPSEIKCSTPLVTETQSITKTLSVATEVTNPECTEDVKAVCADGSVVTTHLCIGGILYPTGSICPTSPDPTPAGCTEGAVRDPLTCQDYSRIYLEKCVGGVWVDSGQECPEAPTPGPAAMKSVYTTTPLLTRVGKRIQIVGLVYCGTERVGGEKAWISIDGELLTTANTRDGVVTIEWTPVVPGLYTICVTVPASSACDAAASGCTMMQVVSELSQEEINAAEAEFEDAKERIGEIMERI